MKADIGELLDQIDIAWVLDREGVTYRESYGRSGLQLNAKSCPFCSGDDHKVYINADHGAGNCFHGGCPQKTFSKWTLISGLYQLKGRELVSMLEQLATEQGWRPKRASSCDTEMLRATLELPESIAVDELSIPPDYLVRRGVSAEIAGYFGLRFCSQGYYEYPRPDGSLGRQSYADRILIPILDVDGQLVSFQGRDVTGEAAERYLFPPGFAAAGSYLYNAINWKEDMTGVVICEGAFDVIGAKIAMDHTQFWRDWLPIGTFGMHLSSGEPNGNDQFGRLTALRERGLKRAIFLWDGEYKALKQAIDASLKLLGRGIVCSIAALPLDKDPGNASAAQIVSALETAMPIRNRTDALKALMSFRKNYPADS